MFFKRGLRLIPEGFTWDITSPWHIRTWIKRLLSEIIFQDPSFKMFDNCIDSAWSNAPGRDICISFVSSPPSSRWDPVCCISPEPQLNSRILLFIFLFFCIFALCYLKDNFVVQHFSHLHFSVSAAAETFYCRVFSVSRNKKLKSNFWKLELLQQQKKKYGALLNNCAIFAKMRDIATSNVLIFLIPVWYNPVKYFFKAMEL